MRAVLLLCSIVWSFTTVLAQDRIYWANVNVDGISSVNASNLGSKTTPIPAARFANGIAYYHANPNYPLFFNEGAVIKRDALSGASSVTVINTTGGNNRGLVIDYIHKKIYWSNFQVGAIGRANLDGSNKEETFISGLTRPHDLDIDPVNQKIYWAESADNGSIKRANLNDGSGVETVVSTVKPSGIAIDPLRNKIYYADTYIGRYDAGKIAATDLNGANAAFVPNVTSYGDIDVDYVTGKIYTVDPAEKELTKVDPDGKNKTVIYADGLYLEYADVTVPHISSIVRQSPTGINAYSGCSATFRVTFSEPVLNINSSDFEMGGAAHGTLSVSMIALNMVYDVEVRDIAGSGILDLNVTATHDIIDFKGNSFSGSVAGEETFTVIPPPVPSVISFVPTSGQKGSTVTIEGVNFSDIPENNTVRFNGLDAIVTASSSTSITTVVPEDATSGTISVTINCETGVSSSNFTVVIPPVITSFTPAIGPVGTTITIIGTNFSPTPADNILSFNGTAATIIASTTTSITANVPAGSSTGSITLTVNGESTSSSSHFIVCTVPDKPIITRNDRVLTSNSETGNQWLKDGIEIGETSKTLNVTDPGEYAVKVTKGGCTSPISDLITITLTELTPSIASFSPSVGPVGTTLIITGENFSANPAENNVTLNGVSTTVTGSTITSITAVIPPLAVSGPISVKVGGRSATSTGQFTVCSIPAKPAINSDGGILTSSSDTGNQWIKNGDDISGATGQIFEAFDWGTYTVRVTELGCSNISDPLLITDIENNISSGTKVFPNPSETLLRIEVVSNVPAGKGEIYSMQNEKQNSVPLIAKDGKLVGEVNVTNYSSGVYVLVVSAGEVISIVKFVKK